jgi:Bacterial PH domain
MGLGVDAGLHHYVHMTYERFLLPGEPLVLQVRSQLRLLDTLTAFIGAVIGVAIWAVALGIVISVPRWVLHIPIPLDLRAWVAVAFGVLILPPSVYVVIRNRQTTYELTTRRVRMTRRLGSTTETWDLRLTRISSISLSQTLTERLTGHGTLVVTPARGGRALVLRSIPDPFHVQNMMYELIGSERLNLAGDHD